MSTGIRHTFKHITASRGLNTQAKRIGLILGGTGVLAGASYISVPMAPVPITMQTLAVVLIGAFYGWRDGTMTVAVWLFEGALGWPVLAGGFGGFAAFLGPTGGYLLAFPLIAALVGWLVEHGWNGHRIGWAFAAMLLAHAVSLALGTIWLACYLGDISRAIMAGTVPFIANAILKSALAATTLAVASRGSPRGRSV